MAKRSSPARRWSRPAGWGIAAPWLAAALLVPACTELARLAEPGACPNAIPAEGSPCEVGLECTYVDPDCGRTFVATCADGSWHFDGSCPPIGGSGGTGGSGAAGGAGATGGGGSGGAGAGPCVDPVVGPPVVISPTEVMLPPDATFGAYRLELSEPVTGVTTRLSWSGPGQLDSVAKVAAAAYRIRFSGMAPGDEATLTLAAGVLDECGTPLDEETTIELGLYPSCHHLYEDFEGDFLDWGWLAWDDAGDGNSWARSDLLDPPTGVPNHTFGSGSSASANDVATGAGSAWDTELEAPAIDLSDATNAVLFYETDFEDEAGAGQAWLEGSADGASWSTLSYWTDDHGPRREIVDLTAFAGGPVYLRWRYTDDDGAGAWWDVDDVCVEEFTKASCPCPSGGHPETADVLGVSNGNGTLGTAEQTSVTLSSVGQRVSVCGMLEDASTSGADYHTFMVSSGLPGGTAQARVSYCLENSFEDATIQVWAKTVGEPLASVSTAHTEGSFVVSLIDGAQHYVSVAPTVSPYTTSRYAVSVEVLSMMTPLLAEGFESWPPQQLTVTDDDGCLLWDQSSQTVVPAGYLPTEGTYLAYFNSYMCETGSESLESAPLNLTGKSTASLSFDMFHDPGYLAFADTIQVQYDIGAGWIDIGPPFERPAATAGWTTEMVDLAALLGKPSVKLRLVATSAYGNDIHLDNVLVLAN